MSQSDSRSSWLRSSSLAPLAGDFAERIAELEYIYGLVSEFGKAIGSVDIQLALMREKINEINTYASTSKHSDVKQMLRNAIQQRISEMVKMDEALTLPLA